MTHLAENGAIHDLKERAALEHEPSNSAPLARRGWRAPRWPATSSADCQPSVRLGDRGARSMDAEHKHPPLVRGQPQLGTSDLTQCSLSSKRES
jgi:hypothetical protein